MNSTTNELQKKQLNGEKHLWHWPSSLICTSFLIWLVTKKCMRWNISSFDISLNFNFRIKLDFKSQTFKPKEMWLFYISVTLGMLNFLLIKFTKNKNPPQTFSWMNCRMNEQVICFQNENCVQTWVARGRWRSVWGSKVCLNDFWLQASPAPSPWFHLRNMPSPKPASLWVKTHRVTGQQTTQSKQRGYCVMDHHINTTQTHQNRLCLQSEKHTNAVWDYKRLFKC